ncbi:unnamed protein product [Ceratitis capitata]|uniref:(Mediterranean fruit fly) hypothetical protein n=1 Tax=Ceratitis capitata TaxID=7213 RepID=A0A811UV01_CERCA|nr:unnamed protein product [Ceratitis capitata]
MATGLDAAERLIFRHVQREALVKEVNLLEKGLSLSSESPLDKLSRGLSPSHVKHENQDDGYETSAGDVLTPNSHSSSTHSLTPQHQIQPAINLIPPSKSDDQLMKMQQGTVSDVVSQQQPPPQEKPLAERYPWPTGIFIAVIFQTRI